MATVQPVTSPDRLRALLKEPKCHMLPSCHDALTARLIEQAGFEVAFMSGFTTSCSRIGQPDVGLISYAEMVDTGRNICASVSIPVVGDGDTGYGNALNVKRTVNGYARAGFSAVMIEDQVAPKRCGHTKGKLVVDRVEAVDRIKAANDARLEGQDILILARTDARHGHGLKEAIDRARAFHEAGADILFVEAPKSLDEMREICRELPGPKMANMIEEGETPVLTAAELGDIGFSIATYPLTLMSVAMRAIIDALGTMKETGLPPEEGLLSFADLRRRVGFEDYYEEEKRYAGARD